MIKRFAAAVSLVLLIGAAPSARLQLDSQIVLERYELELSDLATPKAMIFSYTVSQAGPTNIEARHRIYRSGLDVRDETLAVDGVGLKRKIVQFGKREDRYAIARLAPRSTSYLFLFLHTVRDGDHLDYVYEVTPVAPLARAFVIKSVTIDGAHFLPHSIAFSTSGTTAKGDGELTYGPFGAYWMPVAATVTATVDGKPARERITFGDYRFPPSLPRSTFQPPKPLPHATLPPI